MQLSSTGRSDRGDDQKPAADSTAPQIQFHYKKQISHQLYVRGLFSVQ